MKRKRMGSARNSRPKTRLLNRRGLLCCPAESSGFALLEFCLQPFQRPSERKGLQTAAVAQSSLVASARLRDLIIQQLAYRGAPTLALLPVSSVHSSQRLSPRSSFRSRLPLDSAHQVCQHQSVKGRRSNATAAHDLIHPATFHMGRALEKIQSERTAVIPDLGSGIAGY